MQRETTLKNIYLSLKKGSLCLLVGVNGRGKSSLSRISLGRHLTKPEGGVKLFGLNPFRDTKFNFHAVSLNYD